MAIVARPLVMGIIAPPIDSKNVALPINSKIFYALKISLQHRKEQSINF